MAATADSTAEPLAIVGIGCRFPGKAHDLSSFWQMLAEGRNAWSEVPVDRFNWRAFAHKSRGTNAAYNHLGGHFLDADIAAFDAAFFGISTPEALAIDPQQRIQLEIAYEALENAGIPLESIQGTAVGVYIATFTHDYENMMYQDITCIPKYSMTGVGQAIVANRISYMFDLKGPSIALDTGCSGSLVALHQACQSLRLRETNMALVGGTNLILSPDTMIPMDKLGILNPEGRCFSFDDRGSGYGRGEGVAMVVVKRLEDALQAGDTIQAVIRSTAVGQDGRTKTITLPDGEAQLDLIHSAYKAAGLAASDTGYVEAHGTGTIAGDRVEVRAIGKAFCGQRSRTERQEQILYLGSVKANIGHLESTSGLAGLIKAILVLKNGVIPPLPGLRNVKKDLELGLWGIEIPQNPAPWPDGMTRRASINSFGYGGTNAHAVIETESAWRENLKKNGGYSLASSIRSTTPLVQSIIDQATTVLVLQPQTNGINGLKEEPGFDFTARLPDSSLDMSKPTRNLASSQRNTYLFTLTSKSEKSLKQAVEKLLRWTTDREGQENYLSDLSYTLTLRRSLLAWRYAFVCSTTQDLIVALDAQSIRAKKAAPNHGVILMFTGQGAQWAGMAKELWRIPIFQQSLEESDKVLERLGAGWNLQEEILRDEDKSLLSNSEFGHPATTAVQIALVQTLRQFGIRPVAVLGHSSGEIAAAFAAGALSQASAMEVSYFRSLLAQKCRRLLQKNGAMLAVSANERVVNTYISELKHATGRVVVACVNSPTSTTVSGDEDAINELKNSLSFMAIVSTRLKVDAAYHSHHMEAVADEYLDNLKDLQHKETEAGVRFFSSVSASEKSSDFGPVYWVANLVSKVRFSDTVEIILQIGFPDVQARPEAASFTFMEVGPHDTLVKPTKQTLTRLRTERAMTAMPSFDCVSTLIRKRNSQSTLLASLGLLLEHGYPVNLSETNSHNGSPKARLLTDLPPYCWDHSQSFWHQSRQTKEHLFRSHPFHELLGFRRLGVLEPVWRRALSLEELPWLRDHVINQSPVLPASGYVAMAIEAKKQVTMERSSGVLILEYCLQEVVFAKFLDIPEPPETVEIQVSLRYPENAGHPTLTAWEKFHVFSIPSNGPPVEHCYGLIKVDVVESKISTSSEKNTTGLLSKRQAEIERLQTLEAIAYTTVPVKSFYNELRSIGNHWGTTFALVETFQAANLGATGRVRVPSPAGSELGPSMESYVIHPTTLDALMHTGLMSLARTAEGGVMFPTKVEEISISADILDSPVDQLTFATTITPHEGSSTTMDMAAFKQHHPTSARELCISIKTGEIRRSSRLQANSESSSPDHQLGHRIEWVEDTGRYSAMKDSPFDDLGPIYILIDPLAMANYNCLAKDLTKCLSDGGIEATFGNLYEAGLKSHSSQVHVVLGDGQEFPHGLREKAQWPVKENSHILLVTLSEDVLNGSQPTFPCHDTSLSSSDNESGAGVTRLIFCDIMSQDEFCKQISRTLHCCYPAPEATRSNESHYVCQAGRMLVPRITSNSVSKPLKTLANELPEAQRPFHGADLVQYGCRSAVEHKGAYFVEPAGHSACLEPDDIEVRVEAYELGQPYLGSDSVIPNMTGFSGSIISVGSEVHEAYDVGEKVYCWTSSPLSNRICVKPEDLCKVPKGMLMTLGASIPLAFVTAHYALFHIGRLDAGQTLIVHSAMGAVGVAALKLAIYTGARVIATIDTAQQKSSLMAEVDLPEERVFMKEEADFGTRVQTLTKGSRVELILNIRSDGLLRESLACLDCFGVLIGIGKEDMISTKSIKTSVLEKSIVLASVAPKTLLRGQSAKVQAIMCQVAMLFQQQKVVPPQVECYPLDDIYLASTRAREKHPHSTTIVEASQNAKVTCKTTLAPNSDAFFSEAGTYLVASTFGPWNDHVCSYLTDQGARNILLLTWTDSPSADYEWKTSCAHIISCHVSCESSFDDILEMHLQSLPAIRGIVHIDGASQSICNDRHDLQECIGKYMSDSQLARLQSLGSLGPQIDFFVTLSLFDNFHRVLDQAIYSSLPSTRHSHSRQNGAVLESQRHIDIQGTHSQSKKNITVGTWTDQIFESARHVFATLEYALQLASENDQNCYFLAGIDAESLARHGDEKTLNLPVLSQIRHSAGQQSNAAAREPNREPDTIAKARTLEEAMNVVIHTTKLKISTFVALEPSMIDTQAAIEDLGLDSLMRFEFKDWIAREFHANLEGREISDARSIPEMADTILSRTDLVTHLKPKTDGAEPSNFPKSVPIAEVEADSFKGPDSMGFPRQPLMPLEQTLQGFLEAAQTFCTASELEHVRRASNDLMRSTSLGPQLQARLAKTAQDPKIDNWLSHYYSEYRFLKLRTSLLNGQFYFGTQPMGNQPHRPAERAALVTQAAYALSLEIASGVPQTNTFGGQAVDLESQRLLFNTCREPHPGVDVVRSHPAKDFVVVLRRGHVFKVPLRGPSGEFGFGSLELAFEKILRDTTETLDWIGLLTADGRDQWSEFRSQLIASNDVNKATIQDIESSTFIVCLDDASPATANERCDQFCISSNANRYFDKTLQLVICTNGVSASLFEHSCADGVATQPLHDALNRAIASHVSRPVSSSSPPSPLIPIEEIHLASSPTITTHLPILRRTLDATASTHTFSSMHTGVLTASFLRAHRCATQSGLQIAIQLGLRRFFGHAQPASETVSLAHFRDGRVEVHHVIQAAVARFLDAAVAPSSAALQKLFYEAATAHARSLTRCGAGKGFSRHLLALEWMLAEMRQEEQGLAEPELFRDPVYQRMKPGKIMVSSFVAGWLEGGFVYPVPGGVLIYFEPGDEEVRFSIFGNGVSAHAVREEVVGALADVRALLEQDAEGGALEPWTG